MYTQEKEVRAHPHDNMSSQIHICQKVFVSSRFQLPLHDTAKTFLLHKRYYKFWQTTQIFLHDAVVNIHPPFFSRPFLIARSQIYETIFGSIRALRIEEQMCTFTKTAESRYDCLDR